MTPRSTSLGGLIFLSPIRAFFVLKFRHSHLKNGGTMPKNILILHAPDSDLEAWQISEKIISLGFTTILSGDALRKRSRLETTEAYFELLSDAVTVIIVASFELLNDDQYHMFSMWAKNQKKSIPVIFRHEVNLPVWFKGPILLNESGELGWNRLAEILTRLQGNLFWQYRSLTGLRII